jgi:hypothetical protein
MRSPSDRRRQVRAGIRILSQEKELHAMNTISPFASRLRGLLVAAARDGNPRAYSEYAAAMGLNPRYLPHLWRVIRALKDIMCDDHRRGRPYASVAAVSRADNLPGSGFAELARKQGRYSWVARYEDFVAAEWARFRVFCCPGPVPQVA